MSRIKTIELLNHKYEFGIHDYVHSTLIKFTLFHPDEIKWHNGVMTVSDYQLVIDLRDLLIQNLQELLDLFYKEPEAKHRSKYPGRYRKIVLGDRKYAVNYTTNYFGSMIYSIYCLTQWISEEVLSIEPS